MAADNGSGAAAARGVRAVNRPFKPADTAVKFSQSGGRATALTLIVAILFARLVLSGQAAAVWKALWGPTKPLALTGNGKSNSSQSSQSPPPDFNQSGNGPVPGL